MKSKKIISGLLALSFIFGGTVLPNAAVDSTVISASAEKCGKYYYSERDDGTVTIIDYDYSATETDIVIPSELDGKTVTEIGPYVFGRHNNNITSVTIPETVYCIESSAFENCRDLKKVQLSKNLKKIGTYAFRDCKSLEHITLPDGLKTIGEGAFLYCDNLRSIEFPASLENIGRTAFYEDEKLESITFAESSCSLNINEFAFHGCKSLTEINLPDNIVHIGEGTFCECINLKNLSLPNNTTTIIDYGAFAHNPGLESITIPDKTETIASFEFGMCKNLKEVLIPKSVTSIGTRAFGDCSDALVIKCYKDSAAQTYAESENIKYFLLGETDKTDETEQTYPNWPQNIRVEYSEKYHQVRFTWDKVEGADRYGIAVYLAGKWRVQAQDITDTVYTTPKHLTPGRTYKVAIVARVNGKWDTANAIKNAVTVTIK